MSTQNVPGGSGSPAGLATLSPSPHALGENPERVCGQEPQLWGRAGSWDLASLPSMAPMSRPGHPKSKHSLTLSQQTASPVHPAAHPTVWNPLHGIRLLPGECQQEGETCV